MGWDAYASGIFGAEYAAETIQLSNGNFVTMGSDIGNSGNVYFWMFNTAGSHISRPNLNTTAGYFASMVADSAGGFTVYARMAVERCMQPSIPPAAA